ncbi:unnamed protein product [Linum tenue]|uniref:Flavodoxin-like domain-containing protein n=1 Tax=Linum tenue TaxID=586396 RepID=A0AAV0MPI8_9ROSI|nr:unnamed protein product [Linum tenue]
MDEFDANSLTLEKTVIFVVSTTGQGDAPDAMKVFWKYLLQKNLPESWLEGVHYAVFGLGGSGYQKFNYCCSLLQRSWTGGFMILGQSNRFKKSCNGD